MQNSGKKIRGSAVATDDGLFVFTPYGTREESEKSMHLVRSAGCGTLWETKHSFVVRLKVPKGNIPALTSLAASLIQMYETMLKQTRKR